MNPTLPNDEDQPRLGVPRPRPSSGTATSTTSPPTTPATPAESARPTVPTMPAKSATSPDESVTSAMSATSSQSIESRAGDTGLGRPAFGPLASDQLTEADRKELANRQAQQRAAEEAEANELLLSEPTFLRLPGFVAGPVAGVLLLLLAGVLGIFMLSQATTTLAQLASLPSAWQYAGYAALGVFALAVVVALVRLMMLYLSIRRNRQLSLAGLEELNKRTHLRWLAHRKATEARMQLEQYLQAYPLEPKQQRALKHLGMTEEMFATLASVRAELLNVTRFAGNEQWFAAFRDHFQEQLDNAAAARVQYWARRCGIVTAISPNALVDTLATLYFSLAMLGDLCKIYQLRAGRVGTAVLLSRIFFGAYLAGQVNEMEGVTEQAIDHLLSPTGALGELTTTRLLLGKLSAKAASGALNYFLLMRLGRYAQALLRPMAKL